MATVSPVWYLHTAYIRGVSRNTQGLIVTCDPTMQLCFSRVAASSVAYEEVPYEADFHETGVHQEQVYVTLTMANSLQLARYARLMDTEMAELIKGNHLPS